MTIDEIIEELQEKKKHHKWLLEQYEFLQAQAESIDMVNSYLSIKTGDKIKIISNPGFRKKINEGAVLKVKKAVITTENQITPSGHIVKHIHIFCVPTKEVKQPSFKTSLYLDKNGEIEKWDYHHVIRFKILKS
jgi:hypothetical protein